MKKQNEVTVVEVTEAEAAKALLKEARMEKLKGYGKKALAKTKEVAKYALPAIGVYAVMKMKQNTDEVNADGEFIDQEELDKLVEEGVYTEIESGE